MSETAAIIACVILGGLCVFQVGLAAGAAWGRLAWGGTHVVLPRGFRIASAGSVLIYAGIAFVLLDRAGLVDRLPDHISRPAAWALVGFFALGIVLNAISRSRPERIVMTPVVALLTLCTLLVALGTE
jgi:hypothetical protein